MITGAGMAALSACAGHAGAEPPASTAFVAAVRLSAAPPALGAAAAVAAAQRAQATAATANRSGVRGPGRQASLGAAQVYSWSEGALYRLYASPERVSDIALEPGETLTAVAAGDTARWVVGDTTSGTGPARRTHVLVKPSAPGLRTNLVITTDRRVYHVELSSSARGAMTSISWTYPQGSLLALDRPTTDAAAPALSGGLSIEALRFGYRISGDAPPWRPLRAFDDGRQVFIEFPEGIAQGEAPPLFVTGAGGTAELVNYRVRGRFYVVDRLFERAELRLGARRQQVVRIRREGARDRGEGRPVRER